MVFTSHGVPSWLSDLSIWAEQLAGCLRKGGALSIGGASVGMGFREDEEPVDDSDEVKNICYLNLSQEARIDSGSYADPQADTHAEPNI